MAKIALISLGCAKNLVNSEQMLWLINEAGHELYPDLDGADIAVVNTCGFIESAKEEAIENILELAELKNEGKLKYILVAGCLSERYKDEILDELPEIDALLGCGSYGDIAKAIDALLAGEKPVFFGDKNAPVEETDRVITTGEGWAYLKIAEGCDNHCAYCTIPEIRGSFRSRSMEKIVAEAEGLAEMGMHEIIVVAQDITRYGLDLYGKRCLPELLKKLCEIDGIEWIRLHYLYPDEVDDELIETVAGEEKILKYLDIPIQHINSEILKKMNRRGSGEYIKGLFAKIREKIPGVVLRTSIISGLPGEGEAEFEELCEFLRLSKIERAGVFVFSPEEGTAAAEMDYPEKEVAERRAELMMDIQAEIMDEFNEGRIGSKIKVLCEGFDRLAECYYGRSYAESPDVDGKIFFTGSGVEIGEFEEIIVTDVLDGDLIGEKA